ncbi:MAG: hypothetical protein J7M16_06595, partial [Anaerolineae bacterium]|nr:hypothetical protein [Anaerolineae bacterium]
GGHPPGNTLPADAEAHRSTAPNTHSRAALPGRDQRPPHVHRGLARAAAACSQTSSGDFDETYDGASSGPYAQATT